MRRPPGSRWLTPRRQYAGSWRDNPWINAVSGSSQVRGEGDSSHSDGSQYEQLAAITTWENEGGSLSTAVRVHYQK